MTSEVSSSVGANVDMSERSFESADALRRKPLAEVFIRPHFYDRLVVHFMRFMQFTCNITIGVSSSLITVIRVIRILLALCMGVATTYSAFLIDFTWGFTEGLFTNVLSALYGSSALYCLLSWRKLDSDLPKFLKSLRELKQAPGDFHPATKKLTIAVLCFHAVVGSITQVATVERVLCTDGTRCMVNELLPIHAAIFYRLFLNIVYCTAFSTTTFCYFLTTLAVREALRIFNNDLQTSMLTEEKLKQLHKRYQKLQELADELNKIWGNMSLVFEFLSVALTGSMFFLFMRSEKRYIYAWFTVYYTVATILVWVGPVLANSAAWETKTLLIRKQLRINGTEMDSPKVSGLLDTLRRFAKHRPPLMTSGDAFPISEGNILQVITGMILYMMCLLQIPAIRFTKDGNSTEFYGATPFWINMKTDPNE